MGAMGLGASLHSPSHLPALHTAEASFGVLELGSGKSVRLVRMGVEKQSEGWTKEGEEELSFSGPLNEHIHSLSQASLSNSSASLLSGITFSTSV